MLLLGVRRAATSLRPSCPLALRYTSGSSKSFKPIIQTVSPDGLDQRADFVECIERSKAAEDTYAHLKDICQAGGGEKGAARHVKVNKKVLVRDRIRSILDDDSESLELSVTAGMGLEYGDVPCAGSISVIGNIRNTRCLIVANDATVKGGTSYPITVTKSLRAQQIAAENGLPCVYIVDSGGAFLPLQSEIFPDAKHGGRSFANQAVMSANGVPQVSLVAGMCTAGGAYTPTMADEHIMVHKIANVYLGGPPLVKAALGESISGEELGGATLHCTQSGVADHFAQNEEESFEILRDVISSLNLENVTFQAHDVEEPLLDPSELDYFGGKEAGSALNREEVFQVLARILDGSRFQEFKGKFGTSLVCGFGFVHGQMVGLIVNLGSRLDVAEGQKGAHFVQLCDSRDIPLVFLPNSGDDREAASGRGCDNPLALRERGKMAQIVANARVPKVTVNLTGSVGDDNYTMAGPAFGPRFYFMWPRAVLRKSRHRDEGPTSTEPPKKPKKRLSEFEFTVESALNAASRLTSDGIILPKDTRNTLHQLLDISMKHHVPIRTVNTVRRAAGLPLLHSYGAMRF